MYCMLHRAKWRHDCTRVTSARWRSDLEYSGYGRCIPRFPVPDIKASAAACCSLPVWGAGEAGPPHERLSDDTGYTLYFSCCIYCVYVLMFALPSFIKHMLSVLLHLFYYLLLHASGDCQIYKLAGDKLIQDIWVLTRSFRLFQINPHKKITK